MDTFSGMNQSANERSPFRAGWHFLKAFLADPVTTGSVWPSSAKMARHMAAHVHHDASQYIVELGPGTGCITQALLARGIAPNRIISVEINPRLVSFLQAKFPGVLVVEGDACKLTTLVPERVGQGGRVCGVISSLPLQNFGAELRLAVHQQVHDVLEPAGLYVQYTYSLASRRRPPDFFQKAAREIIWLNFPPARITAYRKVSTVNAKPTLTAT